MIWRNQEINIHSSINDVFICHIMLNFCAKYLEFRRERDKLYYIFIERWWDIPLTKKTKGLKRVFFLLIDLRELIDWSCLTSLLLETYVEHRNLIRKCYKTWSLKKKRRFHGVSNIDLCNLTAGNMHTRWEKPYPDLPLKSIQKVSNMHQAT